MTIVLPGRIRAMKPSPGEKLFYIFNELFLLVVGLLCAAPLLHLAAVSLSQGNSAASGQVLFLPVQPTFTAYRFILRNAMVWNSMLNSIARTVLGSAVNLFFTVLIAYPLSKNPKRFKLRTFFAWFFFVPMIINGGLIPNYILIKELGLIDNIWALILPNAVPIFYILVMLSFFRSLPDELEESALLDGASQWRILFRIYMPLSLSGIAAVAVYTILFHWNSWFDGLLYMNEPSRYPLMTYIQTSVFDVGRSWGNQFSSKTYEYSIMIVTCLPIIISYPFLQRYFVKGMMLGGVKG